MADESRFSVAGSTDSVPDNSNDNSVDTTDAKERKEMESRSTIWEHFKKIFENGKLVKARFLHCHQNYAANTTKNGTSGLR
ncbi:hypothetical protein P3S67_023066 [Capsicum chacoense]